MYFVAGLLLGLLLWLPTMSRLISMRKSRIIGTMALQCHYSGELDAAMHILGVMLKSNPKDVLAKEIMHSYVEGGRTDETLFHSHLQLAIEFPEDPRVHYDLGLLYASKEEQANAHREWEKVIDIDRGGGWGARAKEQLSLSTVTTTAQGT